MTDHATTNTAGFDADITGASTGPAIGFTVSIASSRDVDGMCRELATAVCQTPMHLAAVHVAGSQVYPVRRTTDGVGAELRLELRMRRAGATLDEGTMSAVLGRLKPYAPSGLAFVHVTASPTRMVALAGTAA